MAIDLAAFAKEKNVKYFMVSYTDLFGGQRAKTCSRSGNRCNAT